MKTPMPNELCSKYPHIPEEEIYDAVEIATIKALQSIHKESVGAFFDGKEGLDVYLYSGVNITHLDPTKLRRRNKRRLQDEIEIELMRRQACYEAKEYSTARGAVLVGTIDRIKINGSLIVALQFNDNLTPTTLYAECPVQQQPVPERGKYKEGDSFMCMIVSCLPVSNGKQAMVRTIVSRVARELPSKLLSERTGLQGIRCTKRIPGAFSRILTKYPIPKTEINKVGKELKEHLEVICPTNPRHPFVFTRRMI